MWCNCSRRKSRDQRTNVNKLDDTYYHPHLKGSQCVEQHRPPEVAGESQYNTGNGRFVEHEYSYIADLQPPISTSGPDFGPGGCTVPEDDGEFGGLGQSLLGSGQPQLCRPGVECAAQQCRQVLRQRSAMQLVDHPLQNPTAAFGSVVSLTDAATIAVRGVAPPPPRSNVVPPPPPAAKQNIVPRGFAGTVCNPPGYCDPLENAGNHW